MIEGARAAGGRVVALDVGDVWTGFAISDETGSVARPVEVVGSAKISSFLGSLVRDEEVSKVLVGVPVTLSGEAGHQARRVLDKLDELKDEFSELDFIQWDERFTTRISEQIVGRKRPRPGKSGRRGGRRGGSEGRVDHIAAARMLQEYLGARGTLEEQ